MTAGDHDFHIHQLPSQQGGPAAVHQPASGGEMPGHIHLGGRHRRGAPQQDKDLGQRTRQRRR